jgi:YihY family inner membrane protein
MADVVQQVDELQRRRHVLGFPLAVVYKFFDDQGNYLAAIITYYAFLAIFPLLLISTSVLGFLLQGDKELEQAVLESALARFPIVGDQLGRPEGLQGSTSAVVIGSITALYGVIGLGQAAQNAVNAAWAIPRNSRLNPVVSRLRSGSFFVLGGFALITLGVVSSLGSHLEILGSGVAIKALTTAVTVLVTGLVLSTMMTLALPEHPRWRTLLPGGLAIAVMWQVLQAVGELYVGRVINRASEMNGVFALVLGLVALIYVAAVMAILGIEINVVLAKRLYPRALLTPFTDAVHLTDADRQVYTEYAQAQRHKGFERVTVTFDDEERDD